MAIISISPGTFNLDFDNLDFSTFTNVTAASATGFRFNFADGSYWDFTGSGLVFGGANGLPTAGTVTSFLAFEPGDVQAASFGNLSLSAASFSNFVQTSDEAGAIDALLAGADTITGGGLADDIRSFSAADLIFGGSGDDTIDGQDGNDAIAGGTDNDRIYGSAGDDFLFGDPGNDTVFGGIGNDTATGGTDNDTVYGDAGFDTLDGSDGNDLVYGGTEGDLLNGWIGNDTLYGGTGDDVMVGVAGDDRFYGGDGSDLVDYRGANGIALDVTQGTVQDGQGGLDRFESIEIFIGSELADTVLTGGISNVFLIGVGGNDTINAGNGNDTLAGGTGNDSLFGSQGDDLATGEDGNDIVYGSDGNDFAIGAAGNDLLYGDFGTDTVAGDAGIDTVYGGANNDIVHGGEDNDIVYGDDNNDLAIGWLGDDRLYGGAGNDIVAGDTGNDTIYGGDGNDLLVGHAGNDRIEGEVGDDIVFGDLDSDTVFGGAGNDSLDGFDGNDTTYGGTGNDNQFGDSGDDVVQGDDGNDVLNGGTGNDLVSGNIGDDTLAGNEGSDTLYGGDDGDLLLGFDGDDSAYGDAGADVVSGGIGNDHLFGGAGIDIVFGEDGNDTIQGGTEIDALFGGAGNDTVDGGDGDDQIYGGTGNDLLIGGTGTDIVFFNGPVVTLAANGGTVTVDAGSDGVDTLVGIDSIVSAGAPGIDLASLTTLQGFAIQGDTQGDTAGRSVSAAGDVNGDGFDDVVVGAPLHTPLGPFEIGEVYVVFGHGTGLGFVDASTLTPSQGFIIRGAAIGDQTGLSVSDAGDINGDGFDDVIIGAGRNDAGQPYNFNDGAAWVVFGGAAGFGTLDGAGRSIIELSSLTSAQGFLIQGETAYDQAGHSVSAAGDVNGDGYDDLFVGAPYNGDGFATDGAGYVIFGKSGGFGTVDLSSFGPGFKIVGDVFVDRAGNCLSSAGDFNGDGYDDLLIGAPAFNVAPGDAGGAAYVVFGGPGPFGEVDLGSLGTQGFRLQGLGQNARTGDAVSAAGDVNGDGYDDILIGAYRANGQAGEAYLVFGKASGFGTVDLTSLGTQGFVIHGAQTGDFLGFSVSGAGDINGDGLADILIGEPRSDTNGTSTGNAYLIFGHTGGFADIDLQSLSASLGFVIKGDNAGDYAGESVSAAGDVNGDGFDDLIVGAHSGGITENDTGAAYVIFGAATGSTSPIIINGSGADELLIGNNGDDTLSGGGGSDVFRGGAGNDTIVIPDLNFADIDGGGGVDTLSLTGGGQTLDLGIATPSELESIERIDLTGTGDNTVISDPLAFLDITNERGIGTPAFAVDGNVGDVLQMAVGNGGWSLLGSTIQGSATYNRWVWDPDGNGALPTIVTAELWVDTAVTAFFI